MDGFKGIILISCVTLAAGAAAFSENRKGNLQIMTDVRPAINYVIHHQAQDVTVTQEDIEKGYVDIQKAFVYSISTNSNNGHLLLFAYDGNYVKAITLFDEKNTYLISESDNELHVPYQGSDYITKEWTFRLHLLSDLKPGTYKLPVAVMLSAM
ncbi:MAG: hypothetical protein HZA14_03595 [Nitrospirae bacterium]|nr:hypothetical protein [Nitrospirota bacterium]